MIIFSTCLPLRGGDDHILADIIAGFRQQEGYRYHKRVYHGIDIHEFSAAEGDQKFTYLLQGAYLVGSFSPFLVEDVIRAFDADEKRPLFKERYPSISRHSHIDADAGNLYVNAARLHSLLNIFRREPLAESTAYPVFANLDVDLNEDGLLLNGYAVPQEGEEAPYLYSLQHEKPRSLGIDHLLPLNTAILQFYGFEKGKEWHHKLEQAAALPDWPSLKKAAPAAARLPALLGERVALAQLQTVGEETPQQLLFMHAPEEAAAADLLLELAGSFSQSTGDSLYQEEYSSYTIFQLAYPHFPEAWLGPAFRGFDETFYLQLHNYVVMSNSVQALKSLVMDVEGDNTWRKSLPQYQFLEKTNQEMNYGYYVNTGLAWKEMLEAAEPGWRKWLEEQGAQLRQFNMLAVQLSALDEIFYTNVLLQAVPQDLQALEKIKLTTRFETLLEAPLITKPMSARSGVDKSRQILVQDSLFQLYVLDAEGNILQRDSLDAKLVGELIQFETSAKGRLDYLVATSRGLHLYGPDFKQRRSFPVRFPEGVEAQWAKLIDYNGSRMYRILVASTAGALYMYDLEGNLLEGWQPRQLGGALSVAPGHIRVRGKDCLYAFQQHGLVEVMNRRGNAYSGFPLNLKDSLLGAVYIQPGSDFRNTLFTTVTKGGQLLSFNLEGRITSQQQLYKPDADTRFMLVPDQQHKDFLIARQSRHRLSLLDKKGNMLFEKDYLVAAGVVVEYHNFGMEKELISITDPDQEFTYLYDAKGELLNFEPLNSCCPPSIRYQEEDGSYQLLKSYQKRLSGLRGGR